MNKRTFSIIGLLTIGLLLFWAGNVYGQSGMGLGGWTGDDMMGGYGRYGSSGNFNMTGSGYGMGNNGMMGSFGGLTNADPLSTEEAETAVANYLADLGQENLTLGEIMIFDNHAYAQIFDESAEQGAFEVLIDPATGYVSPEPGPNMMWNTEYSPMSSSNGFGMLGNGMMSGNMMDGFGIAPGAEINVTAAEAVNIAQRYLDTNWSNTVASGEAVAFPGYYTLHVEDDGQIVGMLSVNAYTGQVFLHQWHGDFIEMTGDDHG